MHTWSLVTLPGNVRYQQWNNESVCVEREDAASFILCLIAVSFVSDRTQLSLYLVSTHTMEYSTRIIYKVCVLASSVGQIRHLHLPSFALVIILTLGYMINKHYLGHMYNNECVTFKNVPGGPCHLGKRIQIFLYSIGFLKSMVVINGCNP